MLKRLWLILGPVFCALVLVAGLLFFYPQGFSHNYEAEKRNAVTLTAGSFKSRAKKTEALTDSQHRFVPFFGSSEWLRFDSLHPAVLAEKYDRNYRPYFLGQRGAASLNQYFSMQQIAPQLENGTAVYVVSPQWFTKHGYEPAAFQQFFNSDQLATFLENQENDKVAQHAAQRILQQYPSVAMKSLVEKVSRQEELTELEKNYVSVMASLHRKEDAMFSPWTASASQNYEKKVLPELKKLPDEFSYEALEKISTAEAKKHTTNNEFGIDNHFYKYRMGKKVAKLKGFQKKQSYLSSPEYSDLQLVLTQFAKSKTNVLFVIPPVNAKWMAYTGLSQDMYDQTVAKIRYQLESQGFTNIADFSKDGDKPYFMKDTIHMGWNGWLAFDKAVEPFVSHPKPAPNYQLNDQFFSKDWQTYKGKPENF